MHGWNDDGHMGTGHMDWLGTSSGWMPLSLLLGAALIAVAAWAVLRSRRRP